MLDAVRCGAGELGAAHHLEHPADLLADDQVEMPSPVVVVCTTCVGHGGAVVERDAGAPDRRPGSGTLDDADAVACGAFTTTVDAGGTSTVVASVRTASRVSAVADLARLLVAHQHRVDDLVGAARARRVVRAVEHELAPRDVEQRVRVVGRREQQRRQRLGVALERALGARARRWCTSTRFDATPISTLARAPERSSPSHVDETRRSAGRARYSASDVTTNR